MKTVRAMLDAFAKGEIEKEGLEDLHGQLKTFSECGKSDHVVAITEDDKDRPRVCLIPPTPENLKALAGPDPLLLNPWYAASGVDKPAETK